MRQTDKDYILLKDLSDSSDSEASSGSSGSVSYGDYASYYEEYAYYGEEAYGYGYYSYEDDDDSEYSDVSSSSAYSTSTSSEVLEGVQEEGETSSSVSVQSDFDATADGTDLEVSSEEEEVAPIAPVSRVPEAPRQQQRVFVPEQQQNFLRSAQIPQRVATSQRVLEARPHHTEAKIE
jgi:hypothetical protein